MTETRETAGEPRIIALWAVPRSRSTAFLRMMAQRGDRAVLHEPFATLVNFGESVVDGQRVDTEPELIEAIRELSTREPVFFKDTMDFRYPGVLADPVFLREVRHTFLIRRPEEVIASHFALNENLRCDDVGFARLGELHDAVVRLADAPPVVINSADLVAHPEATVRAYCAAVGLPFDPAALSWQRGAMAEWQQASRWHESTSNTTGFTGVERTYEYTVDNHPTLAAYLAYHEPHYRRLDELRLPVANR
jgi:hypothetical protein